MEAFKNRFNLAAAEQIGQAVKSVYSPFDMKLYISGLKDNIEDLELKGRSLLIKDQLKIQLPKSPPKSLSLLTQTLKLNPKKDEGLSGFLVWPLTQFVADVGLDDLEPSMKALYYMTQVFTAEFAIRSFLLHREKETLKFLQKWVKDPNPHVRRLVSEGTRPYLPWGIKLSEFAEDPQKTWPLLDKLKMDSSEYVRKSVANHLNDHGRLHGDWVLKKLMLWNKEFPDNTHLKWVIRHGTRNLIKSGHPLALKLQGVSVKKQPQVLSKIKTKKISLGQSLEVTLQLTNPYSSPLETLLDHEIQFLKKNSQHNLKVFKGRRLKLKAHESVVLSMKIPFREVTTRKYYSGIHYWAPVINGLRGKLHSFELSLTKST